MFLTGDNYWKITEKGHTLGHPKAINSLWSGLPGNIDAAFTFRNGKTYFFKGNKYWRYAGTKMEPGFPKYISIGFEGIPDNIDSALVWGEREIPNIYFFKGLYSAVIQNNNCLSP